MKRKGWVRIGTVGDLRDHLGLSDAAEAWEVISSDPGIEVDHADGDDRPWVVWMREAP